MKQLYAQMCHPYLRYSHVVSRLLVRIDGAAHGSQVSKSLHVLISKNCFPLLPPLSQSHIQWFGGNNPPVHFSHCFCCFLGRRETDKAKSLALGAISHYLQRHSEMLKLLDIKANQ